MSSISTSKSGLNWLDRLRSTRGFPTGEEPNLDRFLASSSSSSSSSTAGSITPTTVSSESTQLTFRFNPGRRTFLKEKNVVGNVSDVLCELFNMGECSRTLSKKNCRKQPNPKFFNSASFGKTNNELCSSDDLARDTSEKSRFQKKSSRKQPNPRFFNSDNFGKTNDELCSSDDLRRDKREKSCSGRLDKKNCRKQSNPRFFNSVNFGGKTELCSSDDLRREKNDKSLASSGDNSLNDRNRNNPSNSLVNDKVGNDIGIDNGGEEDEVIDMKEYTRSEVTIIDTSLEDWKSDKFVFRKKDEWKIKDKKSKSIGRKRKLLDKDDDNIELKKRDVEGGEIDVEITNKKKSMHLNKPQNDKARELLKEAAEFVGKVSQSRFPCPKPPVKLRIESSPVILFKPIPSTKNADGITRLGKSAKKGRPKKMIF